MSQMGVWSKISPPGAAAFAAAKCNHGELKSKTRVLAANRWFQSSLRDLSGPFGTFALAFRPMEPIPGSPWRF